MSEQPSCSHLSRRTMLLGGAGTVAAAAATSAIGAPHAAADTTDSFLPYNGDNRYVVRHCDVGDTVLTYPTAAARLYGATTMHCTASVNLTGLYIDFALRVEAVQINGRAVPFTRTSWRRISVSGFSIARGSSFTVTVNYNDTPNARCKSSNHNGVYEQGAFIVFGGQPDGAIYWIPSNDRLDTKATYNISVSTQASNHIIGHRDSASYYTFSNGTMRNAKIVISRPVAAHQPSLGVGPFAQTTGSWTIAGEPVLHQFAGMGSVPSRLATHTKQSLDYFASQYGPYPWGHAGGSSYGVLPVGAHEGVGSGIYRRSLVDGTYGPSFIAHENAHMWFGNSVTARQWKDVVLIHEGLAVLLENDYDLKYGGLRSQYTASPSTLVATAGPHNITSMTYYNSAYGVMRELRREMDGSYLQWQAPRHTAFLRALAAEKAYQNITRYDFRTIAERVTGRSLATFWNKYKIV